MLFFFFFNELKSSLEVEGFFLPQIGRLECSLMLLITGWVFQKQILKRSLGFKMFPGDQEW